jgi:hypothetical protein
MGVGCLEILIDLVFFTLIIISTNTDKTFIIKISVIRKLLTMIGRSKLVGTDGIPGEILKMGVEAMISYLARLLDITINSGTISSDWKKAIVVPIYRGGSRSIVQNYRPASLT